MDNSKPEPRKRKTLTLHKLNPVTESFKRPDHNDFYTSPELKAKSFSGLRKNELSMEYEFWIEGEIRERVSFTEIRNDNMAMSKAHDRIFKLKKEGQE
jgi:hypothetical protein